MNQPKNLKIGTKESIGRLVIMCHKERVRREYMTAFVEPKLKRGERTPRTLSKIMLLLRQSNVESG